jgi:hypothetical protein
LNTVSKVVSLGKSFEAVFENFETRDQEAPLYQARPTRIGFSALGFLFDTGNLFTNLCLSVKKEANRYFRRFVFSIRAFIQHLSATLESAGNTYIKFSRNRYDLCRSGNVYI